MDVSINSLSRGVQVALMRPLASDFLKLSWRDRLPLRQLSVHHGILPTSVARLSVALGVKQLPFAGLRRIRGSPQP